VTAVQIEYVTHASLLLRSESVSLLTDPFFHPERDPMLAPAVRNFPPRPDGLAPPGRMDYVFSSHEHHDHCHPETLEAMRDRIGTVLLPAERPELERRYTRLGFRSIELLQNRRPLRLDGGLEVMCAWDDPVDTFLVARLDGVVVYHGNDCRPRIETLREVATSMPVDYAFFCYTSVQDLFPLLLPRGRDELAEWTAARESAFFDSQLERIDALRPRVVVPYSYTPAYLQPEQRHLNGYGRMTPRTFADRLAQIRPAQACWVMQPGDRIDAGRHALVKESAVDLWGRDLDEMLSNIDRFAERMRDELPAFERGDARRDGPLLQAHLRDRSEGGLPHPELFRAVGGRVDVAVQGDDGELLHWIDADAAAGAQVGLQGEPAPSGLRIALPASLVRLMLDGVYDPLMILYTYRVSFRLAPEAPVYAPVQEHGLYVGIFLALFLGREDPLWEEFDPFLASLQLDPDPAGTPAA
jgi:hypothetical protein